MLFQLRSRRIARWVFTVAAVSLLTPPMFGDCASTRYYIYQEGDTVCGQRWDLAAQIDDPAGGTICIYDMTVSTC